MNNLKIKGAGLSALLLFAFVGCKTMQSAKLQDDDTAVGLGSDIERLDPSPRCGFADGMMLGPFDQLNRVDQGSLMGPNNYNKIYKPACENISFVDHNQQTDLYKFRYYVVSFYIVTEDSPYSIDDCGERSKEGTCSRAEPRPDIDLTQNSRSCSVYLNGLQADIAARKAGGPSDATRPYHTDPYRTPVGVLHVLIDGYNTPELARHVLTLAKTGSFDDGFIDLPNQATHNMSFSIRGYRSRQYGQSNTSARVVNISALDHISGFKGFQLYSPLTNDTAPFHYVALNGLATEQSKGTFGRVFCVNDDSAALFPDLCGGITKFACGMKNAKGQTSRECARYASAPKLQQLKVGCAAVSGPVSVDLQLQQDTGGRAKYFINPTDSKLDEIARNAATLVRSSEGNPAGAPK